jgi:sec-independent protein translocase protein TatA
MGSVGWPELLVIALIALLLFGAGRIADIGKGLGQGISNFKKGLKEAEEEGKKKPPADAKKGDAEDAKPAAEEPKKEAPQKEAKEA